MTLLLITDPDIWNQQLSIGANGNLSNLMVTAQDREISGNALKTRV